MSRIGKKIINIPAGTKVDVKEQVITATGKLGTLSYTVPADVAIKLDNGVLTLSIDEKRTKELNAIHGTTRANVFNIIEGVTNGYSKTLVVNGVGYRAFKEGNKVLLDVGFSHNVPLEDVPGITYEVANGNEVTVKGIDKELVGQIAANIRSIRIPDPYHAYGVSYKDEVIARKEGKKGKK